MKMSKHNADNERIKRLYFRHLKDARGLSEASIDAAAKAIHRFESSTDFRSFKKFHIEQVIAFRRRLDEATTVREGTPLSKATALQTLNMIRAFILWLADQPGYRSRIRYSDAAYFRLSEKDTRIAKAPRARPVPTPDQIEFVLGAMPAGTDIKLRNRALIAFTWLTGVRDGALALSEGKAHQLDQRASKSGPPRGQNKEQQAANHNFLPGSR
jgi:integrase